MFEAITNWDLGVLDAIQSSFLKNGFFDKLMPIITMFGEAYVFIIGAVLMLIFKKTRKAGMMLSIALIIGLIVCNITLKPIIARTRPYDMPGKEAIVMLIKKPTDFSFPSGHSTASFEAATVIMATNKKWGVFAVIMACLIAFSRMYLYVHYPTDVFCGIAVGIIAGILGVAIVGKFYDKLPSKIKGN